MNVQASQKTHPQLTLPAFLSEHILHDIGLLEQESPKYQPIEAEALAEPAIRHHVFSIGLNGL